MLLLWFFVIIINIFVIIIISRLTNQKFLPLVRVINRISNNFSRNAMGRIRGIQHAHYRATTRAEFFAQFKIVFVLILEHVVVRSAHFLEEEGTNAGRRKEFWIE